MHGEETQVIKLPGAGEPAADQTQVLSAPGESRPGENRPSENRPTGNGPGEDSGNGPSPSIVGEERPDPGADPTTRLVKPGEHTTADMNEERVGSVLDLERPADEIAEDPTRPLRIPQQRSDDTDRRGAPR